jgi:hypothetical protein
VSGALAPTSERYQPVSASPAPFGRPTPSRRPLFTLQSDEDGPCGLAWGCLVPNHRGVGEGREIPPDISRYTVRDAADILGITTGAVRNRLSRGTLRSIKEHGTVYVLLPADIPRATAQTSQGIPSGIPSDIALEAMRGRIDDLRSQLEAEREANRENRRIIAMLASRVPELEAPPEPRDSPQTATEEQERAESRSSTPWWRRIFG